MLGVVLTLALFLALVWRASRSRASRPMPGCKFAAYLAAGFGLWLGVQAFINIGVNMGVLPTKGLTLPLMSYGRSSLIVTLAWLGVLLRVYHEASAARARRRRTVRAAAMSAARCSSWRAAPAAMCFRRWRWRGCCATRRCRWCGSARARGLEARVVPAEGIPIEWLSVGGLRGKGLTTWLAAPFRLSRALLQALAVMRRHRPVVVVGLGGFVTGPGGVAAWLLRRPLLIHEQNAIAGFTNRWLAHLARQVLEAFPGSFGRDVHAQGHRQSGARATSARCRRRRSASPGASARRACWSSAAARARRA